MLSREIQSASICLASLLLCVAGLWPSASRAAHDDQPSRQYVWEQTCRHPLPEEGSFTPQEQWAWRERICIGKPANLREFAAADTADCETDKHRDWQEAQVLSPKFLATIFFTEPFRSAPPAPRIQITCAWVKEDLNFSNYTLPMELWFDDSRFDGTVELTGLRVEQSLTFDGSRFAKAINARNLAVAVDLRMRRAQLPSLLLRGAHLGGSLTLSGIKISQSFSARSAKIDHAVLLDGGARLNFADLSNAEIGRQISFKRSQVTGKLVAHGMSVKGDVLMNGAAVFNTVNLQSSTIGDGLAVDTARVSGLLDITNAKINGELTLNLGDQPPGDVAWGPGASFILQNTTIGALNDSRTAWFYKDRPNNFIPLDLKGFTYATLGGIGEGNSENMAQREVDWHLGWLQAQTNTENLFTPQPYQQLAKVVGELGFASKRDEILYAMRDSERTSNNISAGRKTWLTMQWLVIGYGYENLRALVPFGLLVLFGVWAGRFAESTRKISPLKRFWFSLDRALPFVELGLANDIEPPKNWVGSYYYIHAILGFILASFLFAGLTGFAG
ncbi:MAG: hypothetical protein AAF441_04525 [Pseudomonadota bacterium]